MKKLLCLMIALIIALFLTADGKRATYRRATVERIDISCRRSDRITLLQLHRPAQIESVLHYLRALEPRFPAEDVPAPRFGQSFTITVYLANGKQRLYQQRLDRYFCDRNGQWKYILPLRGKKLPDLVADLEKSL